MRVSGGVNKIGETDPRSVFCAGSDNQQQEVTVVTSAGISFSGAPDINSTNENSFPMGEDPENLWQSNSSCGKINGNNLGGGCICGIDQCSKPGNPYSSLVLSSHTGPDKQGGSSSKAERGETTIPKNGSPHTGSPGKERLWWARTTKTYNSAPLIQPPPDLVIETDASLLGWGVRCQELHTRGLWSVEEQKMHINALELLAIFLAIRTFPRGRIA